jgi:hypothetical protein
MEVDEEIYNELRRIEQRFYCLVSHGVENWDEYDAAMKDFNKWLEKDKQKEKINSIVDTYKDKIMDIFQPILNKMDAILNEDGIKEVKDILKEMCSETLNITSKDIYEKWANDLMDTIEKIAEEKYPDVPYWLDTGNRYQCCMEMLAHFRKDL